MSELTLSSDPRRRLWQCYVLLLRLAEEAEENTAAESGLCEDKKPATNTEKPELIQSENDTLETEQEQFKDEPPCR